MRSEEFEDRKASTIREKARGRTRTKSNVIIDVCEYRRMLAQIEELAAIPAFDEAKAAKGRGVPFEIATAEIERKRK
jgi:hypothetical protein